MSEPELTSEQEKAAETESYGGVPVSDEELGAVWTSDEAAPDAEGTTPTGSVDQAEAPGAGADASASPDGASAVTSGAEPSD